MAHDLFRPDLTGFAPRSQADNLSPLQSAKERAGRDTQFNCPRAIEPSRTGIFLKHIPKRRKPVFRSKRSNRVAIKPHPGTMNQFDGLQGELQVEPCDLPEDRDTFMHPFRTVDGKGFSPPV